MFRAVHHRRVDSTYWYIRSNNRDFCHQPQEYIKSLRIRFSTLLGQIMLGDKAQLASKELDDKAHSRRKEKHPDQFVLIHRSCLDIGTNYVLPMSSMGITLQKGELHTVSRVNVSNSDKKSRSNINQKSPKIKSFCGGTRINLMSELSTPENFFLTVSTRTCPSRS